MLLQPATQEVMQLIGKYNVKLQELAVVAIIIVNMTAILKNFL